MNRPKYYDFVDSSDIWKESSKKKRGLPGTRKYSYRPYDITQPSHNKKKSIVYKDSSESIWSNENVSLYEQRQPKRGKAPSIDYAMKTPFPTYSQFGKPQLIDEESRQYKWADGSDFEAYKSQLGSRMISNELDLFDKKTNKPIKNGKDALLYLRFKKGTRQQIQFPAIGSKITFFDLKKKILLSGIVDTLQGEKPVTSATGSVKLINIRFEGLVNQNPKMIEVFDNAVGQLPKKYRVKVI